MTFVPEVPVGLEVRVQAASWAQDAMNLAKHRLEILEVVQERIRRHDVEIPGAERQRRGVATVHLHVGPQLYSCQHGRCQIDASDVIEQVCGDVDDEASTASDIEQPAAELRSQRLKPCSHRGPVLGAEVGLALVVLRGHARMHQDVGVTDVHQASLRDSRSHQ